MPIHDYRCRSCGNKKEIELDIGKKASEFYPICDCGVMMVWSPTHINLGFSLGEINLQEKFGYTKLDAGLKRQARRVKKEREEKEAKERREIIGSVVGDFLA